MSRGIRCGDKGLPFLYKNSKAKLIRDFFGLSGSDAIKEIKALTEQDRVELGSAIARSLNLTEADCDFVFVAY